MWLCQLWSHLYVQIVTSVINHATRPPKSPGFQAWPPPSLCSYISQVLKGLLLGRHLSQLRQDCLWWNLFLDPVKHFQSHPLKPLWIWNPELQYAHCLYLRQRISIYPVNTKISPDFVKPPLFSSYISPYFRFIDRKVCVTLVYCIILFIKKLVDIGWK